MLTSNAKKLMAAAFLFPEVGSNTGYIIPIKTSLGLSQNTMLRNDVWPAINNYAYNGNIKVGSGTTAATENDYKLESPITGTTGSVLKTIGYANDKPYITFAITITNTSENSVTISEIGFFGDVKPSSGGTDSVLLDRTLLDTPVTIPAGDSGLVNYSLFGVWGE